jgi:16S rRNA processing protein RimM
VPPSVRDAAWREPKGEVERGSSGPASPLFIAIGRIVRPHGVRGEFSVEVLTDFPERFNSLETIYLGDADNAQIVQVSSTRWHKNHVLMKLKHCDDRSSVETLRGLLVQVPIDEAMPLEEDEFYPHQLIGLNVITVDGESLGQVNHILYTNANDVYIVNGPKGEILLPAISDVIEQVDLSEKKMIVKLMPGLI